MLSKEEIETCKEEARNFIEFMETAGDNAGWIRGLMWYIKQLETREQKLIEKLEEDIREETGYAKWVDSNTKRISSAVTTIISKSQYAKEILEILKKE